MLTNWLRSGVLSVEMRLGRGRRDGKCEVRCCGQNQRWSAHARPASQGAAARHPELSTCHCGASPGGEGLRNGLITETDNGWRGSTEQGEESECCKRSNRGMACSRSVSTLECTGESWTTSERETQEKDWVCRHRLEQAEREYLSTMQAFTLVLPSSTQALVRIRPQSCRTSACYH